MLGFYHTNIKRRNVQIVGATQAEKRRAPKTSSSRTSITKTSTSKTSTVENINCQKYRLTKTSTANKIIIKLKTSHNR